MFLFTPLVSVEGRRGIVALMPCHARYYDQIRPRVHVRGKRLEASEASKQASETRDARLDMLHLSLGPASKEVDVPLNNLNVDSRRVHALSDKTESLQPARPKWECPYRHRL